MCKFFSFCSDAKGNYYYFNSSQRKLIMNGELVSAIEEYKPIEPDSHSTIARFYLGDCSEDKLNKYEYDFITKKLVIDQINIKDDSIKVESWIKKLDKRIIIEEFSDFELFNPLDRKFDVLQMEHAKLLLKKIVSVRDSVRVSVRDSVWASVRDSVGVSVWASVRDSVRDSVWASVWASVGVGVWASAGAYFNLKKSQWKYCDNIDFKEGEYPFQCFIEMHRLGLVPSFDGSIWRLHAGKKADVVFEISKEELNKGVL